MEDTKKLYAGDEVRQIVCNHYCEHNKKMCPDAGCTALNDVLNKYGRPASDDCTELKEKIKELAEIMRDGYCNADQVMLPSESQARAAYLQEKAQNIVEEITGEKWEFSYLTW